MKYIESLKKLFLESIKETKLKECENKFRKHKEVDYFEAYIQFLNNSTHYSRFFTTINKKNINGKYLNEKVNTWKNNNVIDVMYKLILKKYKKYYSSKCYYIDGKIITNKYGCNPLKLGRNIKYKSKNSINVQALTDAKGICLGIFSLKGSDSEVSNMIDVLNNMGIDDCNKYKKSNRHKKYFIADAGYDSKGNLEYLRKKGYVPIIWHNKRKTKNIDVINKRKIKGHLMEKYKTRHKAENFFAWIDNKIPRLARIYDKDIKNYLNMMYVGMIDLIIGRMCV